MNLLIWSVLFATQAIALINKDVTTGWRSTAVTEDSATEIESSWTRFYVFFVAEERKIRFNLSFDSCPDVLDLCLDESYTYYVGKVYYKNFLHGECKWYSFKCKPFFEFGDTEYPIGNAHVDSFSISSQQPMFFLKSETVAAFHEAPLLKDVPGVRRTSQCPHDHHLWKILALGLWVTVLGLLLALVSVWVSGRRARLAGEA
ncbi:uncharacterized protein LOC122242814 [Penaeus japonicus]|uniref:uncharacterized protein LOC122242814 n=1 Tax=Penaeus japonicus TaxID=27405 RepID=UPI001C715FF2|nr:uncharacterized protein LOC122242814 [Penaeus japonicus]